MRPSARFGNVAPRCDFNGVLSSLNRVSRNWRSKHTFGSASISGANERKSSASRSTIADHRLRGSAARIDRAVRETTRACCCVSGSGGRTGFRSKHVPGFQGFHGSKRFGTTIPSVPKFQQLEQVEHCERRTQLWNSWNRGTWNVMILNRDRRAASILGDRVSTSDAVREHHSHGESWHAPGLPDVVVFPVSTEEVAAIVKRLRAARRADRAVRNGQLARRPRQRHSRRRLDRSHAHDPRASSQPRRSRHYGRGRPDAAASSTRT